MARTTDRALADLKDRPLDAVRSIRDDVQERVKALIVSLGWGKAAGQLSSVPHPRLQHEAFNDLVKKLLHVRRIKNETSHRIIPLNTSALNALARMFERADMLGHPPSTTCGLRASGGASIRRCRC